VTATPRDRCIAARRATVRDHLTRHNVVIVDVTGVTLMTAYSGDVIDLVVACLNDVIAVTAAEARCLAARRLVGVRRSQLCVVCTYVSATPTCSCFNHL